MVNKMVNKKILERIPELFSGLNSLEMGNIGLDIRMKVPYVADVIQKSLLRITEILPELDGYNYDEHEKEYVLKRLLYSNEHISISVRNQRVIECEIGTKADFSNIESELSKVIDTIQDSFKIKINSIEALGFRMTPISTWRGNHHRIIAETLIKDSIIGKLFEQNKIVNTKTMFSFDINDTYDLMISFRSNVQRSEIIAGNFYDDVFIFQ